MLPPDLRPITKQIDQAIEKAESRADDRSKRAEETQKKVAIAIDSLTNEFKAYEVKQAEAERKKNRRENITIGSLVGTAVVTLALAVIAGLQWGTFEKQWQTLEKTDHTVRAGQRGFAYAKSIWWRPITQNEKLVWWGLIEWENSGNTPITPVDLELLCPSLPGGGELVADPYALKRVPQIAASSIHITVQIGPKQTKFGGQCTFSVEHFQLVQSRQMTQYVIGQARYVDIYGDAHVTRFCERVYNVKGILGVADPSIEVASIPCVRHNCTDDECTKEDAEANLPPEKLLLPKS
jgi:hypothetical protein